MKEALKHIYIIAGFLLFGYVIWELKDYKDNISQYNSIPDTSIVKHIHQYNLPPNNTPIKITVQQTKDPELRKKAENEDIVTGVKIKGNEVDVQKIDTSGKVTEEIHKIEPGSTVTIDNKGVNEKKKTKAGKFLTKASKIGLRTLEVIGVVAIILIIAKK